MGIRKLGYVGLDVADIDAWVDLFGRTLGVGVTPAKIGTREVALLELDEFKYRLALHPSAQDGPVRWGGSSTHHASSTGSPSG
jgi:extradiol dioxygenase